MSKELEKLEADFKKLQRNLKTHAPANGEKIKNRLQAELKAAWDKEDALSQAVSTARQAGITGKKSADFMKDKTYGAALAAWKKAVAAHRQEVKALRSFCDSARKMHDPLKKQLEKVEKELKKAKPAPDEKKKIEARLKLAASTLQDLEKSAELFSTLKVPEIFYALRVKDSEEKILKDALKESDGAELPKVLEEATLKRNLKLLPKMEKSIARLCDTAVKEAAANPKKSGKSLQLAQGQMDKLTKMHDDYQTAGKKHGKAIAAAPDKKKFLDVIAKVAKVQKRVQKLLDETEEELEQAEAG